jgi:hypothetical protein
VSTTATSISGRAGRRGEHHRDRRDDRHLQVADVARRREVLVLVGDPHVVDTVAWGETGDDRVDELLGRRRTGRHADHARQVVGQLVGLVDPEHTGRTRLDRQLLERRVLDELADPITTIASHRSAISAISADWRLVVAKHRSLRPGVHRSG